MGRLFDRFTSNNQEGSVFHSSGLTDQNTRQIGGGDTPRSSFRSRLALCRTMIRSGYGDTNVVQQYRRSVLLDQRTENSQQNQLQNDSPVQQNTFPSREARPSSRVSQPSGQHTFTEPTRPSRDPYSR